MPVERLTPERRRQLTRTALVEAAAEVFARRGFFGASLDEIAETAGFTRGAIYKNFSGKDELFLAVFDNEIESGLTAFAAAFESAGPELALDPAAMAATWRTLLHQETDRAALFLEFELYAIRNPEVRARLAEHRRRARDAIETFMRDLSERHGFRFTVPLQTLAAIVDVASQGFSRAAHIDPDDEGLFESFIEVLVPMVVEAAEAPTAKRGSRARRR